MLEVPEEGSTVERGNMKESKGKQESNEMGRLLCLLCLSENGYFDVALAVVLYTSTAQLNCSLIGVTPLRLLQK